VIGDRGQGWFIAAKFGWNREKVGKLTSILRECGYLVGTLIQGYQYVWRIKYGVEEIPKDARQQELPFLVPMQSGCPQKPTPEAAGCHQKPTPGDALRGAGCHQKPTAYTTNCIILAEQIAKERETHPPTFPATEEEAIKAAARLPCSDLYVAMTWAKAMSRGGKDWNGKPIADWIQHVDYCWTCERTQNPQRAQQYTREAETAARHRRAAAAATKAAPVTEPTAFVPLTPERIKELQEAFHNAAEAEKDQAAPP
jgi:hypothetical protein